MTVLHVLAAALVAGAAIGTLTIAAAISLRQHAPEAPPRSRRRPQHDDNAAATTAAATATRADLERFRLVREADLAAFDTVADLFLRRHPGAVLYDLRDELQRRAAIAGRRTPYDDDDEGGAPDAA